MKICTHEDNNSPPSFKKKLVFKRWNSATRYVKFYDHRQRFFSSCFTPQNTAWSHIFDNLKFQNFPGIMSPSPPRLACPLGRPLSSFIGHLWKLLLRTLIRYQNHTDQETVPWRLHCTNIVVTQNSTFIWPLKALNIYVERWMYVQRNGGGENYKIYQDLWGGLLLNKISFKGGSAKCYCLELKIPQIPPSRR